MLSENQIVEGFGLSPQQKRTWSLRQHEGLTPYRTICAINIEGNFDDLLLKQFLEKITARHEILRTGFRMLPGLDVPVQVIYESNIILQPDIDLSNLSVDAQQKEIDSLFEEVKRISFGFEKGEILHASRAILSPFQNVLVLSMPAICADAIAMKNIIQELVHTCANSEGVLQEDLPLQYADISEYLSQLLSANEMEKEREYWRKYYGANFDDYKLPYRKIKSHEFSPKCFEIKIHSNIASKLESHSRNFKTQTASYLLSCLQSFLLRVSDNQNFMLGVSFNGRNLENLRTLPGLFARYLPIFTNSKQSTFKELLVQTDKTLEQHTHWQDYFDLEKFYGRLEINKLRYILVCFEYDDYSLEWHDGERRFAVLKQYSCIDRFDIKLSVTKKGDLLTAYFYYDMNKFEGKTIEILANQFITLLEHSVTDPGLDISRLNLLSQSEKKRLLNEINAASLQIEDFEFAHDEFVKQAEKTPDRIAVVSGLESISYKELNYRSDQLACHLIELGVMPEMAVGICLHPSIDMIVSILGILKCGGAYLPLDPSNPIERLTYMLNSANAKILISEQHFVPQLSKYIPDLILIDKITNVVTSRNYKHYYNFIDAENPAYIIFTSGSTGRPKGVIVTHENLRNYIDWCKSTYYSPEGGGAVVHSSISFDLTITGIFPPLLQGDTITLVSDDQPIEGLSDVLKSRKCFNLVKLTPTHLEMLNLLMKPDEISESVSTLVVGGEVLFTDRALQWLSYSPATRIFNEYGPTETTVGSCVYEISDIEQLEGTIPIGTSINNTQIHILNDELEIMPHYFTGEIFIGGVGVTRGYVNHADLTAERFIPDPYISIGGRLYRTGDLGNRKSNGIIEFLGRSDRQIKVKGRRIELDEIESVLIEDQAIKEAAVEVREQAGEKRIIAYIVDHQDTELNISELKIRLLQKLPDYMVPQLFVLIKQLPVTTNGKLDRQRLPEPKDNSNDYNISYVEPRNLIEKALADLWAEALDLERVGVHDNFFELGGDSILGIQIAHRARKKGIKFTPRQLFHNATIASLSVVLKSTDATENGSEYFKGPIRLAPIQQWFFENDFTEMHHWNQAVMFELKQSVTSRMIESILTAIVSHHDALRFSFSMMQNSFVQILSETNQHNLLIETDFSDKAKIELNNSIERFATNLQASLCIEKGPLLRAGLIRMGKGQPDLLLLVIHHLVVDYVSWGILLDDIQTAYSHLLKEGKIQLPLKSTSYKRWVELLKKYADSKDIDQEKDYWINEARFKTKKLHVDFPKGDNTEASARNVIKSLSADRTSTLLQIVPKVYHTLINDVLLSALAGTIGPWIKLNSILVDLESHGREDIFDDIDLARTVGWFTVTFPLLITIDPDLNIGQSLMMVKEQIRKIPNGGIGYGVLRYLGEDNETTTKLKQMPQSDICFNYVGRTGGGTAGSELFGPITGPIGPSRSQKAMRPYLIEINGSIDHGQLKMVWTYSKNIHLASTIEGLATKFVQVLEELIDHCLSPESGGRTSSDFLLPDMNQKQIDELFSRLSQSE